MTSYEHSDRLEEAEEKSNTEEKSNAEEKNGPSKVSIYQLVMLHRTQRLLEDSKAIREAQVRGIYQVRLEYSYLNTFFFSNPWSQTVRQQALRTLCTSLQMPRNIAHQTLTKSSHGNHKLTLSWNPSTIRPVHTSCPSKAREP